MSTASPKWFVKHDVAEHDIHFPGMGEELAIAGARLEDAARERLQLTDKGDDGQLPPLPEPDQATIDAELERIKADYTIRVKLRPLDAGDVARISELRLGVGGASIQLGEAKLLAVELALEAWTLDVQPTRETISQLNPLVFEQIYDLVDVGEGTERTGSPTPPARETAAPAAPIQPEVAASSS